MIRLWKFPVNVYGFVLSLCWLGIVYNGLGGGGGRVYCSVFKSVSKMALVCIVWGSLR